MRFFLKLCAALWICAFLSACATQQQPPNAAEVGGGTKTAISSVGSLIDLIKNEGDVRFAMASRHLMECSGTLKYIPLAPTPSPNYTKYKVDNNKSVEVVADWPEDPELVHPLLNNISSSTNVETALAEGSIGPGIFGGSGKMSNYVIDFIKYRVEPVVEDTSHKRSWARVGAGMRIIVTLTKYDASAGGSLMALAFSAKTGGSRGYLQVDLIGMNSSDVTQAMPFTVDLTEANVQRIIEMLAVVRSKLHDKTTSITPNVISKVVCEATAK